MVPAGQFVRSVAYISRRFKRPLVFIGGYNIFPERNESREGNYFGKERTWAFKGYLKGFIVDSPNTQRTDVGFTGVDFFTVFYEISVIRIIGGCCRINEPSPGINKIVCSYILAVRPLCILADVECPNKPVITCFPSFSRSCNNGAVFA